MESLREEVDVRILQTSGKRNLTVILYRILLHRAFSLNIIRALELISPGFTEPFKTLSYSLTPWVCVSGGGANDGR